LSDDPCPMPPADFSFFLLLQAVINIHKFTCAYIGVPGMIMLLTLCCCPWPTAGGAFPL
jgi:hypothetical protein